MMGMVDPEDYQDFMEFLFEHELSMRQFMICFLLSSENPNEREYLGVPDQNNAIQNVYKYIDQHGKWKRSDIDELKEKGFLEEYESKSKLGDSFEVTDKFMDLVFEKAEDKDQDFEEFWDRFPAFYRGEQQSFPLRSANKDEVRKQYKDVLRDNEHRKVLACLEVAKAQDEVRNKITNWLEGEYWKEYSDEVENRGVNNVLSSDTTTTQTKVM